MAKKPVIDLPVVGADVTESTDLAAESIMPPEPPRKFTTGVAREVSATLWPFSKDGGRTVDLHAVHDAGMRIEYGHGSGFNAYGYRIVTK